MGKPTAAPEDRIPVGAMNGSGCGPLTRPICRYHERCRSGIFPIGTPLTSAHESTAARPLALVKRPDLVAFAQTLGGRTYMGLKDPLALRYYHLRPEEYFVLQQLDGRTSAEQIQTAFEREFAPRRLGLGQLHNFCSLLYREGLLVADAAGQGERLLERRRDTQRRQLLQRFGNVLALRFRGFDPEPLLHWLYPKVAWLFSAWALAAWLVLVASAATLVLVQFDGFQARLPDFQAFFRPENWVWFAVTLAGCKILHELGHALTCKHYGGRCHELGLMLLVFTPCLYVNVSDAWMLPGKRQRMAVSAAGMAVELALAAIAVFGWWFSEPGLLNALCLRVMFLCSASTLIFNGNPLLRYDGYFVLSDWCETPNLRQRADAAVWQLCGRWILGRDFSGPTLYPERHRGWLVLYALLSFAYRIFVLAAILWFCHAMLEPVGLQVVAQLLTVLAVGGMIAVPSWRAMRFWSVPGRSQTVNKKLAAVTIAGLSIAVIAMLAAPLPHRITAPVVLQPKNARSVFVPVAGRLTWAIEPGTAVGRDSVLGRLENPDLEMELARLRGQREVLQSQLQSLKSRGAQQTNRGVRDAGSAIPAAEQALADVEDRLRRREEEKSRLTLISPVAGTVLPPRRRHEPSVTGELPSWSGQPLDRANEGAFLETGTLFCLVGDPQSLEGLLLIDQADIALVQAKQRVRIWIEQSPSGCLTGQIEDLSQIDADAVPPELVAAGMLPLATQADGKTQLSGVFYQAKVSLAPHDAVLLPGATGRARIDVAPLSLGQRLVRYLSGTFRFGG